MKIAIKILITLLILFLLKGCLGLFYIKMTHLSKSDLEWIKSGDALFESTTGKKAKLINMGTHVYNETNPFYISSASNNYYEANAGYHFVIGQDGCEIDGYFSIQRSVTDDALEFDARLNDLYTIKYLPLKSLPMEINGRLFNDCLVIDSSNAKHLEKYSPSVNLKISKFIFNKKYGLLCYELGNGEKYYRKFITK